MKQKFKEMWKETLRVCVLDSRLFSSRLLYSTSRLSSQICNYFCLLLRGGDINQIGLTYAFVFVAEL